MEIFDIAYAQQLDKNDPLSKYRGQFHMPKNEHGEDLIYLCGNSLGLQAKTTAEYVQAELNDWAKLGVEGHFHAKHPWMPYHEFLTDQMAQIVGAKAHEVVVMNSLTVNLHLLMVSFYRPTAKRHKILMDYSPFPSDRYALKSQIKFHGFDPENSLIELKPDQGEIVSTSRILDTIREHGDEIAMIMIGGVNYYTGQLYPIREITKLGHELGCVVGFDLAHAAGNVKLNLHDDGPDFAAWCSYKYLNSGPGSLSGAFVHERHKNNTELPRFAGWWGQDKATRFLMGDEFKPIPGAEGWQLSNPPILAMAAMRASLDIFEEAGMENLIKKSKQLSQYTIDLMKTLGEEKIKIITPHDYQHRGSQVSIQIIDGDKSVFDKMTKQGVIADWREPDVIRIAPTALYNTFEEVRAFYQIIKDIIES